MFNLDDPDDIQVENNIKKQIEEDNEESHHDEIAEAENKAIVEMEEQNSKIIIHQSNMVHWFSCPKKFKLSLIYDIETTMAMRHGRIFETYMFGHKPGESEADFQSEVIGKIKQPTLDLITAQAERTKELFPDLEKGESFVNLNYPADDFELEGEADHIGNVLYDGFPVRAIVDTKYTANINEFWNKKKYKHDFLQSIFYPLMWHEMTGELLPFIYVIVESTFADPLIKLIKINTTLKDFMWLHRRIDELITDPWLEPRCDEFNCLGWKGFGKCSYMEWCDEGRAFVSENQETPFAELEDQFNDETNL